jgi:nucleoside-diphosphate-sugar epimerase
MKIAIFGATSLIAKDLIKSMCRDGHYKLFLYARRPSAVEFPPSRQALETIRYVGDYVSFDDKLKFDALINFVGVGDPATAAQMGADIFDVTARFDQLALSYIRDHPQCRYIFLSSGAAYGSEFQKPASRDTLAVVPINSVKPQDLYGVAKLHAEYLHRSKPHLPIVDVRVFNYFSASQNLQSKFLICDILRSIRDRLVFRTSPNNIVRDYLHPFDFYNLIRRILLSPPCNDVVDSYSRAPIDKYTLLLKMKERFDLNYCFDSNLTWPNATGMKLNYYSINTHASNFGYEPMFTSLDGLMKEADYLISQQ